MQLRRGVGCWWHLPTSPRPSGHLVKILLFPLCQLNSKHKISE
jgi:hypothetical protein